ncbi:MAG: carboxypeptidase-like regulatory domain-containing protein [Acidobacteria bacterium]|nr:carboxypeptidase-like regulatory domain-containing protein [Acidobacteriota bacterium]
MTRGWLCLLLSVLVGSADLWAQQARGRIAGTVVSAATGEAVQGAIVTARFPGAEGRSSKTAASDRAGRFGFAGLPAGRYELRVRKSGYGEIPGSIPRVNLSENEQSEGLVLRLWPSAAIVGRVLDPDGEVVADSQVRAYAVRYGPAGVYWSLAARAVSDDLGEYRLFGLSAGKHVLRVWPPASGPSAQFYANTMGTFYPRVTSPAQALPVEVRWGNDLAGVDLELTSGSMYSITGAVTDASSGGRCVLCFVEAIQVDGTIQVNPIQPGRTSREGLFALNRLAPGNYKLIAQRGRDSSLVGQTDVSIRDGDVAGVEVLVGAQQRVVGRIVIEEPPDELAASEWAVQLMPSGLPNSWPTSRAKVQQDLGFALSGPPALYRLSVENLPEGAYLSSLRIGGRDLAGPEVAITRDAAVSGLEAVIAFDAGTVQGVVQARRTGSDEEPVEANVFLIPEEQRSTYLTPRRVTTAADGSFRIESVVPGRYRLYALPLESAAQVFDPAVQAALRDVVERVDVDAGESVGVEPLLGAP